jgi:AmmeMemoRadiSam system protein B
MDVNMKTLSNLRPSPIAGQWYPGEATRLASSIDHYLESAEPCPIHGQVVAIMAPHAGHLYSGPVAAYAFKTLLGCQADLAAVVSPMHHPYPQPLLTSAHPAYFTPLGEIPLDQEALAALDGILVEQLGFGITAVERDPEHSLEIELPFLQRTLPDGFSLLPVMVRDQRGAVAQALGTALAQVVRGRQAILVASTDLSHFYSQETARQLDWEILREVEAFNPQGVLDAEREGRGYACGKAALAAVMWAALELGANRAVILNYATSGNVSGDFERVVGYGAAVFIRES